MKHIKNFRLPNFLHGADYNYEQWLEYPEILEQDFTLMKEANCNVMAVGIFSWAKLEPEEGVFNFEWMDNLLDHLHNNGLKAILATPTGSKPVWLSKKYPEVCRVDINGNREPHGIRHNHCRTSPIYREKSIIINKKLAERYKDHPALLMWHVNNEYNSGDCFCKNCLEAFQKWLEKRYGTIKNLNRAWWTTFWSHTYSDWKEIEPFDKSVQGLMLDWKRFKSDQTLDFFLTESEPLREITPDTPITVNFMEPDVELDYWSFAPYVSTISWDCYPKWHREKNDHMEAVKTAFYHDLYRSMKDQPFMLMESSPNVTNWQGISIPKKDGMHELSSLQAIAHGSDTVQYFQWRQSRGGEEQYHGAVVTHCNRTETRVFQGVKKVGEVLNNLSEICGSNTDSEVVILYDFHNEWSINLTQHARNIDKDYQKECVEYYKTFWERGISVDIKDFSCKDLSRYKIVIAPMMHLLREDIDKTLKEYVKKGGVLITTFLSGYVDETNLSYIGGAPGPLKELTGIWIEDTEILNENNTQTFTYNSKIYESTHFAERIHAESAEVISYFNTPPLKNCPSVTLNRFEKGQVYFVASRTSEQFKRDLFNDINREINITNHYPNDLPDGVTIRCREKEGYRYYFVMNFNSYPTQLNMEGFTLYEVHTNNLINNELDLLPYGIRVLKNRMN